MKDNVKLTEIVLTFCISIMIYTICLVDLIKLYESLTIDWVDSLADLRVGLMLLIGLTLVFAGFSIYVFTFSIDKGSKKNIAILKIASLSIILALFVLSIIVSNIAVAESASEEYVLAFTLIRAGEASEITNLIFGIFFTYFMLLLGDSKNQQLGDKPKTQNVEIAENAENNEDEIAKSLAENEKVLRQQIAELKGQVKLKELKDEIKALQKQLNS